MNIKHLFAILALTFFASGASATTVIETDCGVIADGGSVDCGAFNLAQSATVFNFEANAGADTGAAGTSGTLTITTFVDPFYSTGASSANILISFGAGGGLSPSATVTYGGAPVPLSVFGPTLASGVITAVFPGVGLANGIDFVLNYSGVAAGSLISVSIAAVPLPASMLLLGGALGGLGLMRRRKKPAAKAVAA